MTGEKPSASASWLPLVEWWNNTTYHSAIQTTPYEALYGQDPYLHLPYLASASLVAMVDRTLQHREIMRKPYRRHSLRKFKNQKLSPRYFGPFPVKARVGLVTYKLLLPPFARIHSIFHVFQLKKHIGSAVRASTLPQVGSDGALLKTPIRVLDRRLVKQGNHVAVEVLVEWADTFPEDSTWENLHDLQRCFPVLILEDTDPVSEEGSIT
ncbi:uncharacterized protein [Gossypium hirsutum]|uniref:Chromo domain-containing protein n=1 Tax=Gossypium hirsutum TaxID=3635 RepID=A0A1U8PVZ1_GOSHI|nr:uncharacterized protein LOC107963272 [Gossypium hirsutum]